MFLALGVAGMIVLVLGCGLVLGADRGEAPSPPVLAQRGEAMAAPSRFFVETGAAAATPTRVPDPLATVPVEFLLSQIEHHIRLEEAAAESFLAAPTAQNLHAPTASRLVN
jgi:hypothetical protein